MNRLAVIPARGGSKRLPGKNIRNFLGRPVIARSIEAAISSGLFSEVMVSTNSAEIAAVARSYGASVPFMRSEANAGDFATIADVLAEVLKQYRSEGRSFDALCCILPTAPLIRPQRIAEAYRKFEQEAFDSLCPVVAFSYPVFRALEIDSHQRLRMIWPEHLRSRSQDLPPAYHDAGSFYWVKPHALLAENTLFCKNGGAIVLDETEVQDIDTETDWKLAELKYQLLHGQTNDHLQG